MTSKEALTNLKLDVSCRGKLSKFQQHCFDLLEKEFKTPTFEECVKEWEDRGWELSDIHKHLDLGTNYYFLEKDMPHRNLNININYKQIRCSDSNGNAEELELDELELAIKTLKALEENKR